MSKQPPKTNQDAATGDVYYVNTWNQEVRWTKPLEMSLFEANGGRPGTGNSSKLSEDDDDDGDGVGGVDSISGRFKRRLAELTEEATLAAEEEEGFLRYVEANMATLTAPDDENGANSSSDNDIQIPDNRGIIKSDKNSVGSGGGGGSGSGSGGSCSGNGVNGGKKPDRDGGDNRSNAREALALASAREWRFVSTDSRLQSPPHGSPSNAKKSKCWYRAESSQYFWGNHPPLLGLLPRLTLTEPPPGRHKLLPSAAVGGGHQHELGRGSPSEAGDAGTCTTTTATGGKRSSDGGHGAGPLAGAVQFHPRFGLVFADRAAGESWLKEQDAGALLARSQKVCDVGPAGWRQFRARGISDGDPASSTALAATAGQGISTSGTVSAMTENSGSAAAVETAGAGGASSVGENRTASKNGAPPLPPFTFFHHAETGDVRWCLSPRSALKTPRTPRREAYHATAAAAGAAVEEHQQQDWGGYGAEEVDGGGFDESSGGAEQTTDDGALALVSSDSGDSWEVVEDGDVVFYYNRKLGVSSWEPPPGWGESTSQAELYGAGG